VNTISTKNKHKKSKLLQISKGKKIVARIHSTRGKATEQVKEFCCLGVMITTDAKCHREIKRRIAIGTEAFSKMRKLNRLILRRNGKTPVTLQNKKETKDTRC